ncbi:MAG: hypothetical protein KA338_21160 [Chloroflexi bacterium]|nr:hypothetical protein [Chloroflexota bacterium]
MTSRVEELYTETRNHPVCQHLVPLESVLSYPVPFIRDEIVYLRFFLYQKGRNPQQTTHPIYRPHAHLTVAYPTGRFVEYVELQFLDGKPQAPTSEQIGTTPHPALARLSFAEVLAKRSELFTLTEKLMEFMAKSVLTADETATVAHYRQVWSLLIEPDLYTYYQRLNPDFFDGW